MSVLKPLKSSPVSAATANSLLNFILYVIAEITA